MIKIERMRSFLLSRIFGLFLITFSVILSLSLASYSINDPSFVNISTSSEIHNYLGFYGAYTSSFLYIFLNYSSYLLPAFLLITGLKSLLGIHYKYFILKLFIFIIGLFFINAPLSFVNIKVGLVGIFLNDLIRILLENYFANFYLITFIYLLIFLTSIILIYYGLTLKSRVLIYIIKKIYFYFTNKIYF